MEKSVHFNLWTMLLQNLVFLSWPSCLQQIFCHLESSSRLEFSERDRTCLLRVGISSPPCTLWWPLLPALPVVYFILCIAELPPILFMHQQCLKTHETVSWVTLVALNMWKKSLKNCYKFVSEDDLARWTKTVSTKTLLALSFLPQIMLQNCIVSAWSRN